MTAFIIKSGICMVLFFGLYRLLLRKEKLFTFNRYYLIFSIIFSLVVPFVSFPVSVGHLKASEEKILLPYEMAGKVSLNNYKISTDREAYLSETPFPGQSSRIEAPGNTAAEKKGILLFVYSAGLLLMLLRFCRNILQVRRMLRLSERIEHTWYRIALLEENVNPFSFFQTVFLNGQDYKTNRIGINILNHELEHVRQAHSFDIIFFEIIHIIFWFNPVLFWYKKAAKINHEYLADEGVIKTYSEIETYATELITFISHRQNIPFTSGFSPSMIKLRLLMLNANDGKQAGLKRIVITLLISFLVMVSISMKAEYKDPQDRKTRKEISENKDIVIQDLFLRDNDFYPLKTLVIMDGKKLGSEDIISVDIDNIKKIVFLANRKATRKYGRNARDGVVEIETYKSDKSSIPDSAYYKPIYTVNDTIPEKRISIPVSNLYSLSLWTYPSFPNQEPGKRWRLLNIMTRDYYKITGKVIHSGKGLDGVRVKAAGKTNEVTTDYEGSFFLTDIYPGTIVNLDISGFSPVKFKVTKNVYTSELEIPMFRINEPDPDTIITNMGSEIRDFSGTWILNKELTKIKFADGFERTYEIHQYDSDSILIKQKSSAIKEYGRGSLYIFNTVKARISLNGNVKNINSCTINPDGQSFSITDKSRSIFANFREYGMVITYTLSGDGNQLYVRDTFSNSTSSNPGREYPAMVFDRE